jgi:hypothetical protein
MKTLATTALLLAGCSPVSDWKGAPAGWTPEQIRFESRDYWDFRGVVPLPPEVKAPKIAVLEFSVQYVTDVDPGTGGVPTQSAGADFPAALRLRLPDLLYATFLELAPEFDRIVLRPGALQDHPAYGELRGATKAEMGVVSPSARAEANRYYPAEGLKVIRDDETSHKTAIWRLIRDLGADAAVQVRLSVGVTPEGKAVIHHNSHFILHSIGNTGVGVSKKPLVGETVVVTRSRLGPPVVDEDLFVPAVKALARPYTAMALVASGRER